MSHSSSTSQLYAKLPRGMVRRKVTEYMTFMSISTPNLRKLLAMKTLDRAIKNRLYQFTLVRRHNSRRRRHGHD